MTFPHFLNKVQPLRDRYAVNSLLSPLRCLLIAKTLEGTSLERGDLIIFF